VTKWCSQLININLQGCFHTCAFHTTWKACPTCDVCHLSYWSLSGLHCVKPINGVRPDIVTRLTNHCDNISLCQQFLSLVLSIRRGIQVQYMLHLVNAFKQNLKCKTHVWHVDNLLGQELWVNRLHYYCASALFCIQNLYTFCVHFMLPVCVLFSSCWAIIKHVMSMGPISKTGCQFKKSWTP
jgi:hypothetical protein